MHLVVLGEAVVAGYGQVLLAGFRADGGSEGVTSSEGGHLGHTSSLNAPGSGFELGASATIAWARSSRLGAALSLFSLQALELLDMIGRRAIAGEWTTITDLHFAGDDAVVVPFARWARLVVLDVARLNTDRSCVSGQWCVCDSGIVG
jgi:hypothetical protein